MSVRGSQALEVWARRVTAGYPGVRLVNMTSAWRDGLAFCAIIHSHRPDLIDFTRLDPRQVEENCRLAFETAERELGIPAILDPADMAACSSPDRLSVLTYLSELYKHLAAECSTQRPRASHRKILERKNSTDSGIEASLLSISVDSSASVSSSPRSSSASPTVSSAASLSPRSKSLTSTDSGSLCNLSSTSSGGLSASSTYLVRRNLWSKLPSSTQLRSSPSLSSLSQPASLFPTPLRRLSPSLSTSSFSLLSNSPITVQTMPTACSPKATTIGQGSSGGRVMMAPVIRRGPSVSEDVKSLRKAGSCLYLEQASSVMEGYSDRESRSVVDDSRGRLVNPSRVRGQQMPVRSRSSYNIYSDDSDDSKNNNISNRNNMSNNNLRNISNSSHISHKSQQPNSVNSSQLRSSSQNSTSHTSEQFRAALQLFSQMESEAREEVTRVPGATRTATRTTVTAAATADSASQFSSRLCGPVEMATVKAPVRGAGAAWRNGPGSWGRRSTGVSADPRSPVGCAQVRPLLAEKRWRSANGFYGRDHFEGQSTLV